MNLCLSPAPEELLNFLEQRPVTIRNTDKKSITVLEPKAFSDNSPCSGEIETMLSHINPDETYDLWLKIGMALHTGGYPLWLWDNWSQKGKKYKPNECARKWNSFSGGSGVSIGTLIHHARQRGYQMQAISRIEIFENLDDTQEPQRLLLRKSEPAIAQYLLLCLQDAYEDIIHNGQSFWGYKGNYWQKISDKFIEKEIQALDGMAYGLDSKELSISHTKSQGILKQMIISSYQENFFDDEMIGINCISGFIRFNDNNEAVQSPHCPSHKKRFIVDAEWKPEDGVNGEYLDILLNGCFKGIEEIEDIKRLIAEIIGCACFGYATKLKDPKTIIFFGSGANGKSQALDLIELLLSGDVCTAIPPKKFGDDKYRVMLEGVLLNKCSELSTDVIAGDEFKNIVSGDKITARGLYQSATFFRSKALHVFASNVLPPIKGGFDGGIKRRLLVLPFERTIPKNERITNIIDKIREHEKPYLLNMAIDGMQRLLKNKDFTYPQIAQDALEGWLYDADSVRAWMDMYIEIDETGKDFWTFGAIYQSYEHFCISEGVGGSKLEKRNFSQRFVSLLKEQYGNRKYRCPRETKGFKGITLTDKTIEEVIKNLEI